MFDMMCQGLDGAGEICRYDARDKGRANSRAGFYFDYSRGNYGGNTKIDNARQPAYYTNPCKWESK